MGIGTGIAIYFVIWWITLFITLPFRAKAQIETGHVTEGTEPAAPSDPQLMKRMIANSILALIVFFVFWLIFYYFGFGVSDLPEIIPIRKLNS